MKNVRLLLSLIGLFLLVTSTLPTYAVEIKGKVVEVEGKKVKIKYQSEYAPREGDEVEFGFKIGDDFIPVEGIWKIVEVSPDFAWAEAEGRGADTPALNYLAFVQSDDPVKRSEIVPAAEKYFQTGMNYRKGIGVKKNSNEAAKWFKKAAELGHAEAQYWLGKHYVKRALHYPRGVELEQSNAQAVFWFKKSAEQGFPDAQHELGCFYTGYRGFPKDYAKALKWLQKAAKAGFCFSQSKLGHMYLMGEGVHHDLGEAEKWYRKAEANWPYEYGRPLDEFALFLKIAAILGHITMQEAERRAIELYRESAKKGSKEAQDKLREKGLSW